MKPVNMVSFAEGMQSAVADTILGYLGYVIKPTEKEIIPILCHRIIDSGATISDLNGFYFGYSIPQIGKEFDFLKIGNDILNIEIKTYADVEKVAKQLKQNKMYLASLGKEMHLYSYIKDTDKLYHLDNDDILSEANFKELVEIIRNQTNVYHGGLDNLFKPYNYLVSPFNATDDFINNRYLLTPQQSNIVNEVMDIFSRSFGNIVTINGDAGTGKSLLLYDIAKQYINQGEAPIIVHVAQLNSGHNRLMVEYRFSISQIKNFMDNIGNLNNFDVILIDEAHRLYSSQLETIVTYVKTHNINSILSYDEKQTMSKTKYEKVTSEKIKQFSTKNYRLGNKIRSNEQVVLFVKSMFDLRNGSVGNLANISLVYFQDFTHACRYIESKQDYAFIRHTPSRYYQTRLNALAGLTTCVGNAHEVIGQEFDNVLVLMAGAYYYDERGKLQASDIEGNPYDFWGMLYQSVTRARQKLEIVIVNNPDLFQKISNILK